MRSVSWTVCRIAAPLLSVFLLTPSAQAQLTPGDSLVIDSGADALFSVNPAGARTVVSDFGDATQGELGDDPAGIAIEAGGGILVVNPNVGTDGRGVLFRVNPVNGARTVVSDFGDATQGELGARPVGVAVVPAAAADVCAELSPSAGCTVNGVRNQPCRGTAGADLIFGTAGADRIAAGGGNDLVVGLRGDDIICGGEGKDLVFGDEGTDALFGEGGKDGMSEVRKANKLTAAQATPLTTASQGLRMTLGCP